MDRKETALNAGWRTLAEYDYAVLFGDDDAWSWCERLSDALSDIMQAMDAAHFAERYRTDRHE
jgi:hypothetical protein